MHSFACCNEFVKRSRENLKGLREGLLLKFEIENWVYIDDERLLYWSDTFKMFDDFAHEIEFKFVDIILHIAWEIDIYWGKVTINNGENP